MSKGNNISFVMPAHNSAETIAESVLSIMNGNFEDGDELIIVDDASTDKTATVINDLKKQYSKIILIKNDTNKGCPASRNVGIRIALNSLIFNLDSDNLLVPGSVKRLKEYLLKENADMAAFSEYHFFKDGGTKKPTHKWIYKPGVMALADFLSGPINPGPGGNFLFTKASWEKIGGYWEYGMGLNEAWGFTLKQLANGAKFSVLEDSYYLHRYGGDSLFVRETKDQSQNSLMSTKMIMPYLDLLNEEDAAYIKSEKGSREWTDFKNFSERPIRLKTGETGLSGYKVSMRSTSTKTRIKTLVKKAISRIFSGAASYSSFKKDFANFKDLSVNAKDSRFSIDWKNRKPALNDKTAMTKFDTHYIYHPAWAARIVREINPEFHTDISSTLSFSSMLSAFIPVRFYDYRPAKISLSNLQSNRADLLHLPFPDNSLQSLSCMHTVEHVGLGRYGEPLDPAGDLMAMKELGRVTVVGGNLLFVVPIGRAKIAFNSHRIYSYEQIVAAFKGFELREFSLIPDNALEIGMIKNATKEMSDKQTYGCGCFWFVKK